MSPLTGLGSSGDRLATNMPALTGFTVSLRRWRAKTPKMAKMGCFRPKYPGRLPNDLSLLANDPPLLPDDPGRRANGTGRSPGDPGRSANGVGRKRYDQGRSLGDPGRRCGDPGRAVPRPEGRARHSVRAVERDETNERRARSDTPDPALLGRGRFRRTGVGHGAANLVQVVDQRVVFGQCAFRAADAGAGERVVVVQVAAARVVRNGQRLLEAGDDAFVAGDGLDAVLQVEDPLGGVPILGDEQGLVRGERADDFINE